MLDDLDFNTQSTELSEVVRSTIKEDIDVVAASF